MKAEKTGLVKKTEKSYRVSRSKQTGFSSPATHYTEPKIDLNSELINNPSATFYIRVADNSFSENNIFKNDVLIVDKSLTPKDNHLALVTREGGFHVEKIGDSESKEEFQVWGIITYIIKSTF